MERPFIFQICCIDSGVSLAFSYTVGIWLYMYERETAGILPKDKY